VIEVIKPANERGSGRSWVFRSDDTHYTRNRCRTAYIKEQQHYCCRTLWSLGRLIPTLVREHRALLALHRIGVPVPEILHFEVEGDSARLVLAGMDDALPLDVALRTFPEAAEDILQRLADIIRNMHAHGWNHGALYPTHVLVGPAPAFPISIIDAEKADRSPFHAADLDRLTRYLTLESPDLARWFETCYQDEVTDSPDTPLSPLV